MDDTSKPNEETPEMPSEEIKDETVKDLQPEPKVQTEEISEKQGEEEPEVKEDIQQDKSDEPKQEKPEKTEAKRETKKEGAKKKDKKDDFKYIVRIANTDIDGEKTLVRGLTSIKGIGMHMSVLVTDLTGLNRNMKIGDLTDAQVEKIKEALDNVNKNAPGWMLNHRKDYETGEDVHLIGSEIDMRLRDEINIMKKIRSYKGIRHERGLPVRGQRTRANSRKGLALGVSKKREQVKK